MSVVFYFGLYQIEIPNNFFDGVCLTPPSPASGRRVGDEGRSDSIEAIGDNNHTDVVLCLSFKLIAVT
jgi:hypothetical protein